MHDSEYNEHTTSAIISRLLKIHPPPITRVKIITLGPYKSGKSVLVKRFCGEPFIPDHIATIGIDYGVHRVGPLCGHPDVRIAFFDTSGHPAFETIRNELTRDADGALVVVDPTDPPDDASLNEWLSRAHSTPPQRPIPTLLVASKSDKLTGTDPHSHPVVKRLADTAARHGVPFTVASAASPHTDILVRSILGLAERAVLSRYGQRP